MRDVDLASATMEIVVERMVRAYPFYAAILHAGVFQAAAVGTLAVTIRNSQLTFLYDPAFVVGQHLDTVMAGLHHEVMHVLHGHLTTDRSKYPDAEARIVAEEVTCNEFIREPLPPTVLRHAQFGLPDDEDTHTRYERLARTNPVHRRPNFGPAASNSGCHDRRSGRTGRISFDDHSVWGETEVATKGVSTIRAAVASAFGRITQADWMRLPASVRAHATAILQAPSPTAAATSTIQPGAAVLPWRTLLAGAVRERTDRVTTYTRANRRFPHLVGVVPGTRLDARRPEALAVIDSSGSMTNAILATISAELTVLSRHARLTICECDTKIQRTYAYAGPVTSVIGRGATDLRPPFERAYLARYPADVVIVFSDGLGPAPATPPTMPVIWVVMADGRAPAPWGHVVRL